MASITKCRSGQNYHEGNAVTVNPVNSLFDIDSVPYGNQNKSWADYDVILDGVGNVVGYYYQGYP